MVASGNAESRVAGYASVARQSPHWDYRELPGSHWLMVSHPAEVTDIILA